MAHEIDRLLQQVHRSFGGGAWHGPSVMEALEGADAKTASVRPIAGSHTIAELVAHIAFSQTTIAERLRGVGRKTTEEDWWPSVSSGLSAEEWGEVLRRLKEGAAELERAIAAYPEDGLDAVMVDGTSAFNNIAGHAQHNAYHAGQMMLLKKLAVK